MAKTVDAIRALLRGQEEIADISKEQLAAEQAAYLEQAQEDRARAMTEAEVRGRITQRNAPQVMAAYGGSGGLVGSNYVDINNAVQNARALANTEYNKTAQQLALEASRQRGDIAQQLALARAQAEADEIDALAAAAASVARRSSGGSGGGEDDTPIVQSLGAYPQVATVPTGYVAGVNNSSANKIPSMANAGKGNVASVPITTPRYSGTVLGKYAAQSTPTYSGNYYTQKYDQTGRYK